MYDKLSELANDELRAALRALDLSSLPQKKGGLSLVGLRNDHLGKERLLLPELPADMVVPHRYEGDWRKPLPELSPEPTRCEAIGDDPVLTRYARCAIYA